MLQVLLRIIGALLLATGLTGCSAIKLGYNALPDLAYWWLDGYLDFESGQDAQVREQLARLHAWHRVHELPRVVALLQQMEQLAPQPVSPQQACAVADALWERLWAVLDQAEPATAAMAAGLRPHQLRHLQRKLGDKDQAWDKEWLQAPAAELRDRRFARWLERLETIYGRLDAPQREALHQALDATAWDARRGAAERQRRLQDLQRTLRAMAQNPADARAQLHAGLRRLLPAPGAPAPNTARTTAAAISGTSSATVPTTEGGGLRAMTQDGCRIFAAVHQGTTTAQREQAVRRLRAWQRDLRELAAQP